MGSPCEIHLWCDGRPGELRALQAALAEIARLEAKYSRYRPDSLLSRINAAAGETAIELDAETAGLLQFAQRGFEQSGGLFDPSAGVLREVWNFASGRPPDPRDVARVLPRIGWQRVEWSAESIFLPAGMELDFGGFVKEYAADAAAATLRAHGLQHGLVNLGGDISLVGPHPDGSAWQLGVRDPRNPAVALAKLPLTHGAMSSSGDYERYLMHQGRRYCHILNPLTGWPVQGLAGVSVVAPQCLIAGALTTVAMLLPPDQALAWLDDTQLPYLCITRDGGQIRGRYGTAAACPAHPAS